MFDAFGKLTEIETRWFTSIADVIALQAKYSKQNDRFTAPQFTAYTPPPQKKKKKK